MTSIAFTENHCPQQRMNLLIPSILLEISKLIQQIPQIISAYFPVFRLKARVWCVFLPSALISYDSTAHRDTEDSIIIGVGPDVSIRRKM